jgi:predicted ABC-type ATPase
VIAGPNGAVKTTLALEFLPKDAGIVHFVNADLIAAGLSPFRPESAAVAAGRLLLRELDRLAAARLDFAFESTLAGLVYLTGFDAGRTPGTASKSSSCGWHHHSWLSGGSLRGSSREVTTCHDAMC